MRGSVPQSGFTRGFLILLVDGDLNLDAPLTVPPTVTVQVFVRGNVRLYAAANATALREFLHFLARRGFPFAAARRRQ